MELNLETLSLLNSATHVAWGGVLHAEEGEGTQCLQRTDRKVAQRRPEQARQRYSWSWRERQAGLHWACRLREAVRVSTVNFSAFCSLPSAGEETTWAVPLVLSSHDGDKKLEVS